MENLKAALQYVNWHHEKYYHCTDTTDRLQAYAPDEVRSTELKWIADEGIKTVPEWILRLREQLSRTYAAMGCKLESITIGMFIWTYWTIPGRTKLWRVVMQLWRKNQDRLMRYYCW